MGPFVNYSYDYYNDSDYMGNEAYLASYQQVVRFQHYLLGVAAYVTCGIGIIGNAMSIAVLSKGCRESSLIVYLMGLAIADIMVLVTTVISTVETLAPDVDGQLKIHTTYTAYVLPYVMPLGLTFQIYSIYMTVAFTIDRYIYICHPFQSHKLCTVSRAWKMTLLIFILCAIYNIPRWFDYCTILTFQPSTNMTIATLGKTPLSSTQIFKKLVHDWLYIPIALVIPLVTITTLNSFLIRAVIQSSRQGKVIGAKDSQEKSTTIMLIAVIFMFMLCQIPALISNLIYSRTSEQQLKDDLGFVYFNAICKFLIIVNCSANIFFYCYFGKKFRRDLIKMLLLCCAKKLEERKAERRWMSGRKNTETSFQTEAETLPDTHRSKSGNYNSFSRAEGQNGYQYELEPLKEDNGPTF
ncbi:FMRFamide receptor-like isoform X2 [Lineus longissimus]|uniref:FMRFamide receptor-like isoform X2 n=1 Tax=Lineus longissimus TaxID=88925 RepID=UPI00315CBE81